MEEQVYAFIEYLASHKRYAANTLAAYRNDLLQFAQFISTERPSLRSWARVDPLLLQAFLLNMKLREYSAASIARRIAAIKAFYFYLFEQHEIVANPTLDLDSPPVAKRPPQALTEEQVEKLLSTAAAASPKGYRDRAILELLYATGLRVSELVALEVSTVDLAAGTLRVGGDSAFRSIPLNDRAREALVLYLERGRAALKAPGDGGPLFVNPRGKKLTRQGIWLILKHYVQASGIQAVVTPHSLRHSFAAHHVARGETMEDLQKLLGHVHLSTTQVYGRSPEGRPVPRDKDMSTRGE